VKLVIEGREYRAVSHETAELLHLMELQQQGRDLVEGGLGMSAISRMEREGKAYATAMKAWQAARDRGEDAEEPVTPDAALTMMAVTIFLTRRGAGEAVSLRDALRVGLSTIVQVPEPTDPAPSEEDGPDPTGPGSDGPATPAGAAAGEPAPRPRRATRSRTSPRASGTGSRSSATGGPASAPGT
jgi:hypothetical protein